MSNPTPSSIGLRTPKVTGLIRDGADDITVNAHVLAQQAGRISALESRSGTSVAGAVDTYAGLTAHLAVADGKMFMVLAEVAFYIRQRSQPSGWQGPIAAQGTATDAAVAGHVGDPTSDTRAAINTATATRRVTSRPGQGVNITAGSVVNTVAGGTANAVLSGGTTGNPNAISGGNEAGTSGAYRVISGGYDNVIQSTGVGADTIAGGAHHRITGTVTHGTISGGSYCTITAGDYSSIGGGTQNTASASGATIAGGRVNTASGQDSTISGGVGNTATGQNDNIAGGINNTTAGPGATVGGGNGNKSYGRNSYIGSGDGNLVGTDGSTFGDYSTIGGGFRNKIGTTATARYSSIPGGRDCHVEVEYGSASGYGARTPLPGSQTWASGFFTAAGDAQASLLTLRRETTDATPTSLTWNGLASPPILPNNRTWMVEGIVIARRTAAAGHNAAWRVSAMFVRDGAGVRVVGATVTALAAEGTGTSWDLTLTSGGSSMLVNGIGAAGQTVRWMARLSLTELAV